MAYSGKTIRNPQTGQTITFLRTAKDTDGRLLEMESLFAPHSKEPVPHYHPGQEEDFTVVSGELTVRIKGNQQVLKAGETLHIPSRTVHSMWNGSDAPAVVNWKVQPALDTEQFLETGIGLADDGKTGANGMPPLLQVALLANKYAQVYRLAKPPFLVQKILFSLLTPIAWLKGYRPTYAKYLD